MNEWLVAVTAADPTAGIGDGGLYGAIIGGIVTITVAIIAKHQKKKTPPVLSPVEQAANLNYRNLRQELQDLRAEFARYKADTEKSEAEYRRQVGLEMADMRATVDYKDDVINALDDEVLDLRDGLMSTPPRYPPLPTRKPRPRRTP